MVDTSPTFYEGAPLFTDGLPAFGLNCCCGVCCPKIIEACPTLYGLFCLTNCECDSGDPRKQLTFETTWDPVTKRYPGSVNFPGCAQTMQFYITCVKNPIHKDEMIVTFHFDKCIGDWTSIQLAETHCLTIAHPWVFSGLLGGADTILVNCCPDWPNNPFGPFPQVDIWLYCSAEDRALYLCDP